MIATLLKALVAVLAVYLVVLILAWKYQDRLAFPGQRSALPRPGALGIADGERIVVTAVDGVQLYGWYLPPDPPPADDLGAPGLVWFYGNMETVEGIGPILRAFRPPGFGVLALDYRGYGQSEGSPTEAGVYLDGEAAFDAIAKRPEIDSARIAVYGRSIGSAVALHVATNRAVRAVVLESPFTSGRDMVRKHYPFLPASLLRMSLDNLSRAAQLDRPLLVFHGTDDRIAPIEMGRAVAAAGRAEDFVAIRNAGHNDTYWVGGEQYRTRLIAFLTASVETR